MPEAGDETREAKSAQVTEPNMLRGKNRSVPAEAIEGVVKRIDLARPEIFWPTRKRSQMSFEGTDETPSTGAVDSGCGWHSSAARIAVVFPFERAKRRRSQPK